ncbi:hypothetical protein G9A89_014260 [Geosiphon pyriformis]|nr:hypothetical protein G9A89_014260 [Geosiphon pyriformis]
MGMLVGNCMSGIAVGVSYCISQLSDQREKIETFLSFGASRWEAGRPIAIEAIRLALLPTINSMMTGQIIAGAPIMDAVKYQQILMFMISGATALGVLAAVLTCIFIVLDRSHKLRADRISNSKPFIYQTLSEYGHKVLTILSEFEHAIFRCLCFFRRTKIDERRPLLRQSQD